MQKIFVKYFVIIMVITVFLTVAANSLIQTFFAISSAKQTGAAAIHGIADRIESNRQTAQSIKVSIDENYVTRAMAFAEMIAQNPSILDDVGELQRIADLLKVSELHVSDENGVLRWGTVPEYFGVDYGTTDQTRPFLPALTDKGFALAQSAQPNGVDQKLFQYIGVARQDAPGIVQVGVSPEVLEKAFSNSTIDTVISDFNVDEGENVLVIESASGVVLGDSSRNSIGMKYSEAGIPQEYFELQKKIGWIKMDDGSVYAMMDKYDDYVIAVCFTDTYIYARREDQNTVTIISNSLLGFTIILSIFILLGRKVITDIETVNSGLKRITAGDLSVTIDAHGTPEFVVLSSGINDMVDSLKKQLDQIASQSASLDEAHKSVLASLTCARRIQNNLLPTAAELGAAFSEYSVIWEPKDEVGGDIYWVKSFETGSVLCGCDCTGHGTPGALLTMLVATLLEMIVTPENCSDTAQIMTELDKRLITALSASDDMADINDGADLAIMFIAKDGSIAMSSANTRLFICDGRTVQDIRGQKLSIGDGGTQGNAAIKVVNIPANPNNRYYVASDGLFDQIGGDGVPFGYKRFKQVILENHSLTQEQINEKIWDAFIVYMGDENRRDDVTLMSFRP